MEVTTLVAFGITSGDGVVEKRRVKGKVWLEFILEGDGSCSGEMQMIHMWQVKLEAAKVRRCICSRCSLGRCPKLLLKPCCCMRVEPNMIETCASETEDQLKDQSQVIIKLMSMSQVSTTVSSLEWVGTSAWMMSMSSWQSICLSGVICWGGEWVVWLGRCIYWWGFVVEGMPR